MREVQFNLDGVYLQLYKESQLHNSGDELNLFAAFEELFGALCIVDRIVHCN